MNIDGLRARAAKKGVRIIKRGELFRLYDTTNDELIQEVEGVLALEDAVTWIDQRGLARESDPAAPRVQLSLPVTEEPDRFGRGYHDEWISGHTFEGGEFAIMIRFDVPQRLALRYTPPEGKGETIVQSVSIEELATTWLATIEQP